MRAIFEVSIVARVINFTIKKICLLFLFICGANILALSQEIDKKYFSSQWTISVEARNFSMSERILNDFFVKNNIKILTQNTSLYTIQTEFVMERNMRDSLDGLLERLGYVAKKDYSYKDVSIAVQSLEYEITQLKESMISDADEIKLKITASQYQIDTLKRNMDKQPDIEMPVRNLEDEIAQLNNKMISYKNETQKKITDKQNQADVLKINMDKSYILLKITEEDKIEDNVTFVNMPGYEYGILFTENPTKGLSAQKYQMHAIKFLFTRGKSYFLLGILSAMDYDRSDATLYTEYFIFNFGQDFYTRHLGRGKRRYINPYISYQIGGFLASRQSEENRFLPNASVALGAELIKTRIFLLDSKASYFMPIHKSFVYMRGVQIGIGANVLF